MQKNVLIGAIIVTLIFMGFLFVRNAENTPTDDGQALKKITEDSKGENVETKSQAKTQKPVSEEQVSKNVNQSNNDKIMELKIQTTQEGTGAAVKAGDTVAVQYTGKLTDGTVFDATSKHGGQAFSFKVGAGMVIKGWDQGLIGMKVGEKRTLTIPGDLAYGPSGIPGTIPANATLVFDIELESIK